MALLALALAACTVEPGCYMGKWVKGEPENSCAETVHEPPENCTQIAGHSRECGFDAVSLCANETTRTAWLDLETGEGWMTFLDRATGCYSRFPLHPKE